MPNPTPTPEFYFSFQKRQHDILEIEINNNRFAFAWVLSDGSKIIFHIEIITFLAKSSNPINKGQITHIATLLYSCISSMTS